MVTLRSASTETVALEAKASVPDPSALLLLIASVPALSVMPPVKLLDPVSVCVEAPFFTRAPPTPVMVPEKRVLPEVLLMLRELPPRLTVDEPRPESDAIL